MGERQRVLACVAALAGAALLLESTLTRLLAVAQFYHFAFLAVSLALLGFGVSGSLLALSPRLYGAGQPEAGSQVCQRLLAASGIAFASSAALAYALINWMPFDSYSIAWDRRQVGLFALYYLALAAPFMFAGLGIGGALASASGRSHRVYAANLLGSGLGALAAPAFLALAGVPGAFLASGVAGLLSAGLAGPFRKPWLRRGLWAISLAAAAGIALLGTANLGGRAPLGMVISPYKGLAHARRYPGSQALFGRWNAISRVDVIASAGTRLLPGLSYAFAGEIPPQHGLSLDADSLQPISLVSAGDFEAAAYLPEAVAFQLRPQARAAVLEPAGGLGVLQALSGGASQVTAVLGNPLVGRAVAHVAPQADIYRHAKVRTVEEAPRVFLQRDGGAYDVLFLPLTDPYRPVTSGAYSLVETYPLTVEAFAAMLERLAPQGLLVATRWLQTPPSEEVRLIAALVEAMALRGIKRPQEALVAYRGVQTLTAILQPDGWTSGELAQVRAFLQQKRYDLVWAPGIDPAEVNRFNRLPEPVYYQAVRELFQAPDRRAFYAAYPFDITPPIDDRPFFFHFFKWSQTPELLAALGHTWQPFGGSGYFVLLALLALVSLFSAVLILAPLRFVRRSGLPAASDGPPERPAAMRIFFYFAAIGLAFLFVEIPLIQRGILLLGHPTYAFTLVVLALLAFSSLGASLARAPGLRPRLAFAGLVALALITPWLVRWLSPAALALPFGLRGAAFGLSLAPLAVLMGLPFPLGLAWLEARAPQLVPWAWAVNGCASVVAAALAALLALSYGFTVVLLLGAAAYAAAFFALAGDLAPRLSPGARPG